MGYCDVCWPMCQDETLKNKKAKLNMLIMIFIYCQVSFTLTRVATFLTHSSLQSPAQHVPPGTPHGPTHRHKSQSILQMWTIHSLAYYRPRNRFKSIIFVKCISWWNLLCANTVSNFGKKNLKSINQFLNCTTAESKLSPKSLSYLHDFTYCNWLTSTA